MDNPESNTGKAKVLTGDWVESNVRMMRRACKGFSMVEVALALGVMAFAFLTLVALLPAGVKTNQISVEETRAVFILTALDADLRNTHPAANGGQSLIFGLPLPWQWDAVTGARSFSAAAVSGGVNTIGLKDNEKITAISGESRARFQVSVVYLPRQSAGDLQSTQARLIVNWPPLSTANTADLTDPAKVSGFVETIVSFPAP